MYAIVTPEVCIAALATLAPDDWKFEHVERKTRNVIKDAIHKVEFEQRKRKEGSKLIRLKINRKQFTATYSTAMSGSIKEVKVKVLDLHDWLWDIQELLDQWGESSIESVSVPAALQDFCKAMFVTESKKEEKPEEEEGVEA